jgi:hypothetical protein
MNDPRIPSQPPLPVPTAALPTAATLVDGQTAREAGQAIEQAVQQSLARSLAQILQPGEIVTGRVVDQLSSGSYLFAIRGRTMVAESSVPLLRDSAVAFEVLSSDDQLRLRLVGYQPSVLVNTSTFNARLAQLGLPNDQLARTVLAAFEQAQAPLVPERMQAVLQQARAMPESQLPVFIAGQARLAQSGLPVTPATTALAERSLQPQLPNAALAVRQLQQDLTRTFPPATSAPVAAETAPLSGRPPGFLLPPSAARSELPQVAVSPTMAQADTELEMPAIVRGAPQPNAQEPARAPTQPQAAPASPQAGAMNFAPTPQMPGPSPQMSTPTTLQATGVAPPTAAPLDIGRLVQAFASIAMPDPGIDGVSAVEKALSMIGLKPGSAQGQDASRSRPAVVANAAESAAPEHARARATPDKILDALSQVANHPTLRDPAHAAENDSVKQVIRELAAETVFKPSRMKDYDYVLPLPLQDRGQPTPARLAIAQRRAANGVTATYVRVDAELSNLGPISVRLNGSEATTLGIHLFASERGREAIMAVIPDLHEKLQESGIVASIRVSDFSQDLDDDHGA